MSDQTDVQPQVRLVSECLGQQRQPATGEDRISLHLMQHIHFYTADADKIMKEENVFVISDSQPLGNNRYISYDADTDADATQISH